MVAGINSCQGTIVEFASLLIDGVWKTVDTANCVRSQPKGLKVTSYLPVVFMCLTRLVYDC